MLKRVAKLCTDRVLFYKGDLKAFRGKTINGDDCGFDVGSARRFLVSERLIQGDAHPSYAQRDFGHNAWETVQFRHFVKADGWAIHNGPRNVRKGDDILMERLISRRRGALIVECMVVRKEDGEWCYLAPSESTAGDYLRVEVRHALARERYGDASKGIDYSVMSAGLSDLKKIVVGDGSPVGFHSHDICAGCSNEPFVELKMAAAENRDWAVNRLELALQQVLFDDSVRRVFEVYAHLRTFGDEHYKPSRDLGAKRKGRIPYSRRDVLAALTQEHYKPALEAAARAVQGQQESMTLLSLL
ncbi:hypothetical protein KY359_01180 [Candidatus Woesearchaeota archaeon]|nr:hypothetical protein [Candidatus Woesearchaeota archaeon]